MADRVESKLAFVLLELPERDGSHYVLQVNRHLAGYSFLGGHVKPHEERAPQRAALRELREELGAAELADRWGVEEPDDVPEEEWERVREALAPRSGPGPGGAFLLPFFSLRAERRSEPPEKLGRLYFFHLPVTADAFPALHARLERLTRRPVGPGRPYEGQPVCRAFGAEELLRAAWANAENPFPRFAIKQGLLPAGVGEGLGRAWELQPAELELALERRLRALLEPVPGFWESLDVHVRPPEDGPEVCRRANTTRQGALELRWSGSAEVAAMPFPYPECGVFVLGSEGGEQAGCWTWHPRLVPRPGLRVVRKPGTEGKERHLVLGLPRAGWPGCEILSVRLTERDGRIRDLRRGKPNPPRRPNREVVLAGEALTDLREAGLAVSGDCALAPLGTWEPARRVVRGEKAAAHAGRRLEKKVERVRRWRDKVRAAPNARPLLRPLDDLLRHLGTALDTARAAGRSGLTLGRVTGHARRAAGRVEAAAPGASPKRVAGPAEKAALAALPVLEILATARAEEAAARAAVSGGVAACLRHLAIGLEGGSGSLQEADDADLAGLRLATYPSVLLELATARVAGTLRRSRLSRHHARGEGRRPEQAGVARLWAEICSASARRLVPWPGRHGLRALGWLHWFDPDNALDAVSALTALQRCDVPTGTLERLPVGPRQPHDSFDGLVCPVETPESSRVGLTLHLARAARVDVHGRLHRVSEDPADALGHAAAAVPFYQHNDGTRAMMAAKNLRQAVPIAGADEPRVLAGAEGEVTELLAPLGRAGLLSDEQRQLAVGTDLLVAYLPWRGWNVDDAIVANRQLAEDGLLDWTQRETRGCHLLPGFSPAVPGHVGRPLQDRVSSLYVEHGGLRRPGPIAPDDPVAWVRHPQTGELLPVPCGGEEEAVLESVELAPAPGLCLGRRLTWTLLRRRPLSLGDKLMGRYGNKGVVSALFPPDELPRLPDHPGLPEGLRGQPVDLVLNPHGVISRMNLGQLVETHVGLLHELDLADRVPADLGRPYAPDVLPTLQRAFEAVPEHTEGAVDRYGRVRLDLPGGGRTASPVVVGLQHFVRLRHVPALKAQARRGGRGYAYDLVTGQAARGRRRRGGARLGEMEVWALAAHQAHESLREVLTTRSDPAARPDDPAGDGQTFAAIEDHLFAAGIAVDRGRAGYRLRWAEEEEIRERCGLVRSADTWARATDDDFVCPKCRDKAEAAGDGPRRLYPGARATGEFERTDAPRLTVGDVVAAAGYRIESVEWPEEARLPAPKGERVDAHAVLSLRRGEDDAPERVEVETFRRAGTLTLCFELDGRRVSAYVRKGGREGAPVEAEEVPGIGVSCPLRHRTTHVEAAEATPRAVGVPGGLCDPDLFGRVDLREPHAARWGAIELHCRVKHPWAPKTRGLELLPVLPLKYRYDRPRRTHGDQLVGFVSPFSTAYSGVVDAANDLRRLLARPRARAEEERRAQKDSIVAAHRDLEARVVAAVRLIGSPSVNAPGRLFGKHGLIWRSGLGRRVDRSARLVIVPDPELSWDQCGVPTQVLVELLGDRIAAWRDPERWTPADDVAELLAGALLDHVAADRPAAARRLLLDPEFWERPDRLRLLLGDPALEAARRVLLRWLAEHPGLRVLLNRQPSLHRTSVMALSPVPLPAGDGLVLKVHPLVCRGFGADFDGDEMNLHLPHGDRAQAELSRLDPTRPGNLLSVADGRPVAAFSQDFVLGHYLLGLEPPGSEGRRRLWEALAVERCEDGRCAALLPDDAPWDEDRGEELLVHLCRAHPDRAAQATAAWMRLALQAATDRGTTIGFLELAPIRPAPQALAAEHARVAARTEPPDGGDNGPLDDLVRERLEQVVGRGPAEPGFGVAAMAVSGARGRTQVRQLLAARGYLWPGVRTFRSKGEPFYFESSLLDGMDPDTAFAASYNTRSSMCDKKLLTARAGALTRKLVLACWPWVVVRGDCGIADEARGVATCGLAGELCVCEGCYYASADGGLRRGPSAESWPAGLLAAQSFGERGTQLSMQAFHTGERTHPVEEVAALLHGDPDAAMRVFGREDDGEVVLRDAASLEAEVFGDRAAAEELLALLGGRPPEDGLRALLSCAAGAPLFVRLLRHRFPAYGRLDRRHLELIWLVLHASRDDDGDAGLGVAWRRTRSPLAALVAAPQLEALLQAVEGDEADPLGHPLARLLTGRVPEARRRLPDGE